ncbi:MAG: type IV pilus assembly protein PilM [Pseudobdellovibrio sp.]
MFFSSKKTLGLDIGSSSIKLAELTLTKLGASIDNFALTQSPVAALNSGEITDPILVAETIKAAFKENGFRNKKVCVGLSGTAVIVKKISMPQAGGKNIMEQVRYEAAQYLPFDINQVTLDFHRLKLMSSSPENMDLLIVAAQNEFIFNYLKSIQQANLTCSILDVNSLALANIFELNYGRTDEPVAIFNFGSTLTNFLVLYQGEVIFSRDIPVGGFHFTNEISKNMGVTFEEAESLKISQGQSQEVPEDTRTFMNMALEYVTEEIRNSIDFYAASSGGLNISKAYYTGGASLTAGLVDHLNESLIIPFEAFDPYVRIRAANKKLNPAYLQQVAPFVSVVFGLALREAGK